MEGMMANCSRKNETLVISLVLNCSALFLFLSALKAMDQGHFWDFLLCSGSGLTFLLAPKDHEFFKTKISSFSDLTKLGFYTDPLTAAFLTMSQFMMAAGLLGALLFGR
jgi:uncharacterized membrane protein